MTLRAAGGMVITGALIVLVSCSGEPDNYSDCILQNVKSGMSDYAAMLVTEACREKFPEAEPAGPTKELVDLPFTAQTKLTGRLRHSYGSTWNGNIYNANEDWQVEELRIRIAEPGWTDNLFVEEREDLKSEQYLVDVSIPPLSNESFTLSINWDRNTEYEWHIVSAKGRKAR